ncbi:MAG: IS3 family transposase [Armatimonadota bacterium]
MVSPERKRAAVRHLQTEGLSSQRRACDLVEVSRSSLYYTPHKRPDEDALRERIKQLARENRRYGYRRIWAVLRREDWEVNHKRVHRIWKKEGLSLPRKRPRRRSYGPAGKVYRKAERANQVWTYDICEERTERGQRLRLLSVVDEYTRECLAIEVAPSIGGSDVVQLLKWLALTRGLPGHIRSDNGPEFIAKRVRAWIQQVDCETIFITPGSPWENPYIESFTGKLRDECLNCELFADLQEAQTVIEYWREEYNTRRPHSSLGYLTPQEFAQRCAEGDPEARRCMGSGRATPSLLPYSETTAATLSL